VVDLIRSLAYPLPVRIICSLLGVPEADEATFTGWSRALARSLDPTVLRSAEVDAAIADAESGLAAYLEDLLAVQRTKPGDDLLSALLDVEADRDRISPDEGATDERRRASSATGSSRCFVLPTSSICSGARWISSPGAVDKLLRFDSPVQLTQRVVPRISTSSAARSGERPHSTQLVLVDDAVLHDELQVLLGIRQDVQVCQRVSLHDQ
jgi:pimeloyl-[acyl-carrier protein] synthase